MNRAQRRAQAARIVNKRRGQNGAAHVCDFTGGITCQLCGRTVTADEIPALMFLRFATAPLELGTGHGVDPPRPTQKEQINEIAKKVDSRRVEGKAVIWR